MTAGAVPGRLCSGEALAESAARRLFDALFRGRLSRQEAKAVLLLIARRGETAGELRGCVRALKRLEPPRRLDADPLLDTCGTGGDGSHSFNISTLSAFVIAGAGGKVAKHGNRGISSRCGSSDLMEALGVRLDAGAGAMLRAVRDCGIGYFHAPFYHPVFARIQPLRRELGIRTLFNVMGPLVNPVKIRRQLIGVGSARTQKLYTDYFRKEKPSCVLLVTGAGGMDELHTAAASTLVWIRGTSVKRETVAPEDLGLHRGSRTALCGGSVKANRREALRFLNGKSSRTLSETVLMNAGAGLVVAGIADNLRMGVLMAKTSLDSGKALEALNKLRKMTQKS